MTGQNMIPMNDIIVVIPGLLGSELQHHGKDIWAVSHGSIWNALRTLTKNFANLTVEQDDTDADSLDDGITATKIVDDIHLLPGLWKIDGYTQLLTMLRRRFTISDAAPHLGLVSNLHTLPYDWRRDNRVAARKLNNLVHDVLPQWQKTTGRSDAKVIVIAHSMGGLIASHWIHQMGGSEHCRALVTFGTPFRGAPLAASALNNGIDKFGVNLTDLVRSFTSVHQLLPMYQSVAVGDKWFRPAELDVVGIDRTAAEDGLTFLRGIEGVGNGPVHIRPYSGVGQTTTQSLALEGNTLTSFEIQPSIFDPHIVGGDGTVPRVSAIPPGPDTALRGLAISEQHAVLQSNPFVLDDLYNYLAALQSPDFQAVRGMADEPVLHGTEGINLSVPDLALASEPLDIHAYVTHDADIPLKIEITCDHSPIPPMTLTAANQSVVLPPGVFRVHAYPERAEHFSLNAVSDIVVVIDPSEVTNNAH